ncbi:MAG: hypothetical protein IFK94_11925 [Acidobacteria bacterium]|uniref:Uncharacterized protein n=1 Tax=Candidatus Polarisedimenticola svalbardensis TaxID=2886004 RepID=A0A8J6Y7M8_9BACT|nr:hypothetical protein [Candidatus Polarisedimenticola svalbardensis]
MYHRFRVLGSLVALTGPDELVAPIAATYARFTAEDTQGETPGSTIVIDPGAGEIRS